MTTDVQATPPKGDVYRYAGRRLTTDYKVGQLYVREGGDPASPEDRLVMLGKRHPGVVVGDAVRYEAIGGDRWRYHGPAEGIPPLPADDPLRVEWLVADRRDQVEYDRRAAERKREREHRESIDQLTIAQLREQLMGQPAPKRAAILATVLLRLGV